MGAGAIWLLFGMGACVTETRSRISIAGLDFQVEETDCDTLAKDASVSVYGLSSERPRKTLLFKYGPGLDVLPSVNVLDGSRLQISAPSVVDVTFQAHMWMNHSIEYQIGQVPDAQSNGTDGGRP
jgi:hypothetical protein